MSGREGKRGWVLWVVLVVVFLAVALIRPSAHRPYDLASTEDDGYRGLKLLLSESGATVSSIDASDLDAAAAGRFPVVYVPVADSVGAATATRWRAFAENGGRLVLGTPSKEFGTKPVGSPFDANSSIGFGGAGGPRLSDVCTIEQLGGAKAVEAPLLDVDVRVGGRDSCYGDGTGALVVVDRIGAGEIFTLANPDLFTNVLMGAPELDQKRVSSVPDNAVLAVRLLGRGAAGGEARQVAVVTSGIEATPVDGTKGITDFIPWGVKLGLLELGAAFAFYALFRGRRHGRVVPEPVPVTIAGSAFVGAVGDLLERQGAHARAAEVLRASLCRELAQRLGVPVATDRSALAMVVAERTGRDPAAVWSVLSDPVDTESSLVSLTRELDSLRQEALHV
ncbi:MAG: DUF4350 domain-containing protein [Acidimicrobiales bacterium]